MSTDPSQLREVPPPELAVSVAEVTASTPEIVDAVRRLARALPRSREEPTAEDVQRTVDCDATTLLVARETSGEIIGMMTLVLYRMPTGMRVWLEDVSVARRGKGVGRALTDEALRRARAGGARDVHLIVDPSQAGGLKMAHLMGFGSSPEDTLRIVLR